MASKKAAVSPPKGQGEDNNAINEEKKSPQEEALSRYTFDIWRVDIECPYCGRQGRTVMQKRPGRVAWIICIILLFTFPILSCLPVLMPSMMDIHHHCLYCHRKVGERRIYRSST